MSILTTLPLLAISLVVYTFLTLVGGTAWINTPASVMTMANVQWAITWGDLFLWMNMLFLFVEIVKATATNARSIVNHGLSIVVFIISFALLVMNPAYVNSAFANLVMLTLIDTVGGFIITIISARRDFDGSGPIIH
jgi:hypothetical protein